MAMAFTAFLSDQRSQSLGAQQTTKGSGSYPGADPHGIGILVAGPIYSSNWELLSQELWQPRAPIAVR